MCRRAVFLDRDGTINVEKHYLFRPEEFEFYPGAVEAIGRLNAAGFLVIVVTNQSGVARGYFTEQDVATLHRHVDLLLAAAGARVDAYYICPHHPEYGNDLYRQSCDCRKGKPGMLDAARSRFSISMSESFMVGDKASDIQAAQAAGALPILVKTGYGETTLETGVGEDVVVASDLLDATNWILSSSKGAAL